MKFLFLNILISLSLLAESQIIVKGAQAFYKSQNGIKDYDKQSQLNWGAYIGYITAINDSANGLIFCTSQKKLSSTSIIQYATIVSKYVREHPELWASTDFSLAMTALRNAFPCQKNLHNK